ncbi:DNA-binding response OmpR family regulator [Sphingopyxis sp. OAS728]|uniref:response regulator n=1 Tax=Sphingopyxis sp. OAS728 TaxID=2663823 RepID=UPI0019EC3DA8|nr:response regulator [Sphingopyxis sp. OAS728]MBE1529546.1 DNA-binding response OmpR family regulator [Sphingopyxis sp. OAS728]
MTFRILIVEDDPLVAMMLEGYLEALDLQTVGCVESVGGALACIRDGGFDAAILDVHLASGETSGPVALALKAADLPFIVTTGSGASDDVVYDGAPLLTKPFNLQSLETALAQLNLSA